MLNNKRGKNIISGSQSPNHKVTGWAVLRCRHPYTCDRWPISGIRTKPPPLQCRCKMPFSPCLGKKFVSSGYKPFLTCSSSLPCLSNHLKEKPIPIPFPSPLSFPSDTIVMKQCVNMQSVRNVGLWKLLIW